MACRERLRGLNDSYKDRGSTRRPPFSNELSPGWTQPQTLLGPPALWWNSDADVGVCLPACLIFCLSASSIRYAGRNVLLTHDICRQAWALSLDRIQVTNLLPAELLLRNLCLSALSITSHHCFFGQERGGKVVFSCCFLIQQKGQEQIDTFLSPDLYRLSCLHLKYNMLIFREENPTPLMPVSAHHNPYPITHQPYPMTCKVKVFECKLW